MINETLNSFSESGDVDDFEVEDTGLVEGSDEIEKPFDPKKVDVVVTTPALSTIIARLSHGEIDLMPDFQRSGDLWSKQMQSRLIESILIRLPIPAFYFDVISEEKWQVVDGLQRLSAINNFVVKKTLSLTNLEFLREYEGYKYDDLPRALKRRIEEFQTTIYLIRPGTPPEMKYSLFHRINTGGLKLTPQEIRHAMSQSTQSGLASNFLSSIVGQDQFIKVVGKNNRRMSHQELALRHLAFAIFGTDSYKSSLPKFLDLAMIKLSDLDSDTLNQYMERFLTSVELADAIFGEDAFRKSLIPGQKRLVNKPMFEALSVCLSDLNKIDQKILLDNREQFRKEFADLLSDADFNETISRSTASTVHVLSRFKKVRDNVNQFIEEVSQ